MKRFQYLMYPEGDDIDLTLPEGAKQPIPPFSDQLVLIGAPVYGGRLPVDAIKRFKQLKASRTPVVLIVVYGNRAFEDALLILKDLAIELGFNPVAGDDFIGEHSLATKDVPIANGRPDSFDVRKAMDFGLRIRDKVIAQQAPCVPMDFKIPGRSPYAASGARSLGVSPRIMEDHQWINIANWLNENCSICKEPQFFWIDG